MDWVTIEAQLLERSPDGHWVALNGSNGLRAHHSLIVDQPHADVWSSIVAEHIGTSGSCRAAV